MSVVLMVTSSQGSCLAAVCRGHLLESFALAERGGDGLKGVSTIYFTSVHCGNSLLPKEKGRRIRMQHNLMNDVLTMIGLSFPRRLDGSLVNHSTELMLI